MKKIYVIFALAFGFSLAMCKKKLKSGEIKNSISSTEELLGAPPVTQAVITDPLADIDQWKRLAVGFSRLLNDPATCNNFDLRVKINNLVASNNDASIRMGLLHNNCINTAFNFNVPTTSNHDLYDAAANTINNFPPPTSIATWKFDFYTNFTDGNLNAPYLSYVTIGMPMREAQFLNGNMTKPSIIMPDPEEFQVWPMTAYSFNAGTNSVTEMSIAFDDYEDIIESGNYSVFTLYYDSDIIFPKKITSGGCMENESYVINDGECDEDCDENNGNSPNDCGNHQYNKYVYLLKFKINEDKKSKSTAPRTEKMHWESWASGKYEPFASCWTLKPSGTWSSIQHINLEDVKLKDVKRTRVKNNNSEVSKGTSNWKSAKEKNSALNFSEISKHYNPLTNYLYFTMYERDPIYTKKFKTIALVNPNGGTLFDSSEIKGELGCFMGKTGTNSNGYYWGPKTCNINYFTGNQYGTTRNGVEWNSFFIRIDPNSSGWQPGTFQGRQVMYYKHHANQLNSVDFELMYFVNEQKF